jgi:hypothetical protein
MENVRPLRERMIDGVKCITSFRVVVTSDGWVYKELWSFNTVTGEWKIIATTRET